MRRFWWLSVGAALVTSGCGQVLGLGDYELSAGGESGSGGEGGTGGCDGAGCDPLCRDKAGRTLVCGASPLDASRSCGTCSGEAYCSPDQAACLHPGDVYCGGGVVCAPDDWCEFGGCSKASSCSAQGLVCGQNPLTGAPCGQCEGGTTCAADQRSCQSNNAACTAQGLVCGDEPSSGEPCGQCPSGKSCTIDQRACVGDGETYCGGGLVCGASEKCLSGQCVSTTASCAMQGRICGLDPQTGGSCGPCPSGEKCDASGTKCVPAAVKTCSNGQQCSVLQACPSQSGGLCATFCEARPVRCGVVPDPNDAGQVIDCGACKADETCMDALMSDGTKGCAPADKVYCGADVLCSKEGSCYKETSEGLAKCCEGQVTFPIRSDGLSSGAPQHCCEGDGQAVVFSNGQVGCCPESARYPCSTGQACCASPS